MSRQIMRLAALFCALLPLAVRCPAYSVLTHEAIIDSLWKTNIQPMLLQRFPNASEDDLHHAHAYLYGGSLIQDLGYAPFGSHFFSDLAHYARTGDFVTNLIAESQNLNEYAFALGSLAHYTSDSVGHPAINRIEPMIYPKLRARFGPILTYEDQPSDHIKTEFAMDVIQIARGLYAPEAYHDFIGFEVAQDLLERAFRKTYGIEFKDIVLSEDLAIGTYRFAAGRLIPEATKIAWESKRADIRKLDPSINRSKFTYGLPGHRYRKEWGSTFKQPGFFARFASALFRLIPTFGPFKPLGFRPVPPVGEQMFLKSFDATVDRYRMLLTDAAGGTLKLPAVNLDTGSPTKPGEYRLADNVYVTLLDKLADKKFATVSPDLRTNILQFFAQKDAATITAKTSAQLETLRSLPALAFSTGAANPDSASPHDR